MHQKAGVPSIIVALEFTPSAVERDMPQQLLRQRRLMDETWLIQGPGRQVLAVLMPLGDASTAEGFRPGWSAGSTRRRAFHSPTPAFSRTSCHWALLRLWPRCSACTESRMLSTKLGLSAVLMELAAWSGPVLFNSHSDAALISYLIAHAIASTLLALLILPLLRGEQARPRTPILAFLALCSYTVPIAGFLGVFAGLLVLRYYRSPATHSHFDSLQLPEFDQHQRVKGGFRQTGLRSFLGNTEVPMDSRMRAMVSLQHVSGRVASPLLRNVLNDTSEDLRLLAYGMLDTLEQRISRSVDHELQAWRVALATEGQEHPGPLTLKAAQNLSDLYWEFIYQGLARGPA
jgi:hypothetical protein